MIKYEVNKPFPFPHPMSGSEVTLSEISTGFFDIKCYLSNPTSDEIRDWRKGKVAIAIYEQNKCPFCVVQFASWSLDASINILKIKHEDDREKWLNTDGNLINLYLIDSRTNMLRAMRTLGVNFSEGLRDILEEQVQKYDSADSVDRRIAEIQNTISTDEMFSRAKLKMKFDARK